MKLSSAHQTVFRFATLTVACHQTISFALHFVSFFKKNVQREIVKCEFLIFVMINLNDNHGNNANRERMLQPQSLLAANKNTRLVLFRPVGL